MDPTQQHQNFQWSQNQQDPSNNPLLRGLKLRIVTGTSLLITGFLDVIIASILIRVQLDPMDRNACDSVDRVAAGIWGGVFAIITGIFGIYSRRQRAVVVTYMILCIIAAVLSAMGAIFFIMVAICTSVTNFFRTIEPEKYQLHIALYISMCLMCIFQLVMSITGASFTCSATCGRSSMQVQQMVIHQPIETSQTAATPLPYPVSVFTTSGQSPQSSPPSYDEIFPDQAQPKRE